MAIWYELAAQVDVRPAAVHTYQEKLTGASPLLSGMAARAGFDDTKLVATLATDADTRTKYIGDIRGVFAFAPGGREALPELLDILRQSLPDTPAAQAAVQSVGNRLTLAGAKAGRRQLLILSVIGLVLLSGCGC